MDVENLEHLLSPPPGPRYINWFNNHIRAIAFLAVTGFVMTLYILNSQRSRGYISVNRETIFRESIIKERLTRTSQVGDESYSDPRGCQTDRRAQPGTPCFLGSNSDKTATNQNQTPYQRDRMSGADSLFGPHPGPTGMAVKRDQLPAIYIFLGKHLDSTTERDRVNMTGYLVYSPSCHMPDTPPFDESIKHLYEKQKERPCSRKPPLTSVSRSQTGNVLYLHKQHFARYKTEKAECCFTRIWRSEQDTTDGTGYYADNNVTYGKCIKFYDNVPLNDDDEFIRVTCTGKKRKRSTTIYKNMHAFVGWKPQVRRKMRDADKKRPIQKTLNVMIIGLDNVSRKNLIRTMPKTVDYLENNGWVGLKGYNKIGENTFPNMLAVLAGMNVTQIVDECWPNPRTPLDECPLIWENFSQKGFITAYVEDEPYMSTFNFNKAGFKKSPTDYYLRPFMLAAPTTRRYKGLAGCMGPVSPTEHILNYSINFVRAFNDYPTFSLFWLNAMHEDLNRPTTIDGYMKHYFKELKQSGAMNTTMVIFMSDHGMRNGEIRETYIGYIEERLPFIYFWLPEWFKNGYPMKMGSLVKNANRLTSPYDVYLTLTEVLGVQTVASGCPKCVSLFKEVPWNRSCEDAGISSHWCTCTETIASTTAPVTAIANFVVREINNILQMYTSDLHSGTRCARLQAEKVLFVRGKIFPETSGYEEFVIIVQTSPGNATFEATVSHNTTYEIIDSITRINSYGTLSNCIDNYHAKNYCFCEMVPDNIVKASDILWSIL